MPAGWVAGFGSLVHSPGFAYARKVEGYIHGYRRVFWQGSTDHRGVPGAPGRVVTLHEEPNAVTVRLPAGEPLGAQRRGGRGF